MERINLPVFLKGLFIGIALCVVLGLSYVYLSNYAMQLAKDISLNEALASIERKEVSVAKLDADILEITYKSGENSSTSLMNDAERDLVYAAAMNTGTKIILEADTAGLNWIFFLNFMPILIGLGIFVLLFLIYTNLLNKRVDK